MLVGDSKPDAPTGDQGPISGRPSAYANRAQNPFYDSMGEVAPRDIARSFMNTRIVAIGIAAFYCYLILARRVRAVK